MCDEILFDFGELYNAGSDLRMRTTHQARQLTMEQFSLQGLGLTKIPKSSKDQFAELLNTLQHDVYEKRVELFSTHY